MKEETINDIIDMYKILLSWAIIFPMIILIVNLLPTIQRELMRFTLAWMVSFLVISAYIIPVYILIKNERRYIKNGKTKKNSSRRI